MVYEIVSAFLSGVFWPEAVCDPKYIVRDLLVYQLYCDSIFFEIPELIVTNIVHIKCTSRQMQWIKYLRNNYNLAVNTKSIIDRV